ncbi:MAG: heterodisulfide reductase-related iron-sulfur binding cluster [Pseudomonadota bacterium]
MHPLIDQKTVETIFATGKTDEKLPDRIEILEKNRLPYDQEAENIIITGCQILSALPHVICSLSRLFHRRGVSHAFLSKEYCCGNLLYRPAIKARDDQAMSDCRELSREFVAKNIQEAKRLGARRLVIVCSPCYPIYKHAFPEVDIVFYPAAISELMEKVNFKGEIDYYAGCYRLHGKFSPVPMDLESTNKVFEKIEGLDIHRISAPKCCFSPEGLSHMIENVKTDLMVHICTGCYMQAVKNMREDRKTDILMLPEFVERIMDKDRLHP